MQWTVEWHVLAGSFGAHIEDQNRVWLGDRVRFTLSLLPDPNTTTDELENQLRDARQPPNWSRGPKLIVTGHDGAGDPVSVPVRHRPSNILQFDYHFRYQGRKQLTFSGAPREVRLPTHAPSGSSATLFPPLDHVIEVIVRGTQRGGDTASTQGAAGRSLRRGEAARRAEGARIDRFEDQVEAAQRRDSDQREAQASERRREHLASARPHRRRAIEHGLLTFRVRTAEEIGGMRVADSEEYFLDLQAAINSATPLDLRDHGWRNSSRGRFLQEIDRWDAERTDDGQIKVWQHRSFRSTQPTRTPRGFRYPAIPTSYNHGEIYYPADGWIAARIPGHTGRSLLPAAELPGIFQAQRWDEFLTILSMLDPVGLAEDVVLRTFEQLTGIVVPPEIMMAFDAATMIFGIVHGLQRIARTTIRSGARGLGHTSSRSGRRALSPSRGIHTPSQSSRRRLRPPAGTGSRFGPTARGTSRASRGVHTSGSGGSSGGSGGFQSPDARQPLTPNEMLDELLRQRGWTSRAPRVSQTRQRLVRERLEQLQGTIRDEAIEAGEELSEREIRMRALRRLEASSPELFPGNRPLDLQRARGLYSGPPEAAESIPRAGTEVGTGFETHAIAQVVDADGNRISTGFGAYLGRGAHAEPQALSGLGEIVERDGRAVLLFQGREIDVAGGRLMVVVDQLPCSPSRANCSGTLRAFANRLGLELEVLVPTRPSLRGSGQVSPRTAARGWTRYGRPSVSPRRLQESEF